MGTLRRVSVVLACAAAACRVAKDTASGDPGRWHFFAVANGDSSFIDTQTLRDSAGVRRVWIRRTMPGPNGQPIEATQYEFNCVARTVRTRVAAPPRNGDAQWSPWQPVPPRTYPEAALEAACALAPAADPT